ncbi:MAG: hypothetical protein N2652_01570 [Kiritimatiellae bacterium]|nr:hypothetical protein [Kiritimatiellia bacterium]
MSRHSCSAAFGAWLLGCAAIAAPEPTGSVHRARALAEPLERAWISEAVVTAVASVAESGRMPAFGRLALHEAVVADRWAGLAAVEEVGLRLAEAATRGDHDRKILAAVRRLGGARGLPPSAAPAAVPPPATAAETAAWLAATVAAAAAAVEEALAPLPPAERRHMIAWAPRLIGGYRPQLPVREDTRAQLQNDAAFVRLAASIRWPAFEVALAHLASLASSASVARIWAAWSGASATERSGSGVRGAVLLDLSTPHGRVLVGGAGANRYENVPDAALIVDVGGDDEYVGPVAAAVAGRPVAMVLDLDGCDRYVAQDRGLGSGWLGIGVLVDLNGADHYELGAGGGGVGAGGLGVVYDVAGDDVVVATAFSIGVGVAGTGLWLDLGGNDRYGAQAFAMGLGAAAGVGALVDTDGNDRYRCGFAVPSGYNASERPNARPGDPGFQYDAFGLGLGLGRRVLSQDPREHAAFALAGGLGIVMDLAGDDRYEASNFALGCGYYFGIGVAMDGGGDDEWTCARYGLGAGAHAGVALCVDREGRDRYATTGPTYAAGCAWDGTVGLFLDNGGDDEYRLAAGDGPALADIGSWSAFVELAGDDVYELRNHPGRASRGAATLFVDVAGRDRWSIASGDCMTNGLRAASGGALRADLSE